VPSTTWVSFSSGLGEPVGLPDVGGGLLFLSLLCSIIRVINWV
jgi:hypothetical protein